jgi:outer membrane receptor for ferrienterochelin and colicin
MGAFLEYTYDNTDNFSLVLGGRVDNHNRLGIFATPRLHVRYNPWEKAVLRFSVAGASVRRIFLPKIKIFLRVRARQSVRDSGGRIYGLDPEIAWNYGLSFGQKFKLFGKNFEAQVDFYRTDFENQIIVDVMESPQTATFYNGKSYANSLQVEFNFEFIKHLDLRTAYKYYDIATEYLSGTFQRPLQAKHRFLRT